jgi:hypothetical protein
MCLLADESGGVGVMTGRDDLGLLAWSQRKMNPLVLVYQYNSPLELKTLQGDAVMEYKSLVFRYIRVCVKLWNHLQQVLFLRCT